MSTETIEKTGRGGTKGPRTFKATPTARDRVISESLASKVKELTGLVISPNHVRAVKFSLSRWYDDPATKELMNNMDSQLKRAKAQEKKEKAEELLREAQAELGDADEDDDDAAEDSAAAAASLDEDEDEDVFADDKVSASF